MSHEQRSILWKVVSSVDKGSRGIGLLNVKACRRCVQVRSHAYMKLEFTTGGRLMNKNGAVRPHGTAPALACIATLSWSGLGSSA